jgi:hypothetical protein
MDGDLEYPLGSMQKTTLQDRKMKALQTGLIYITLIILQGCASTELIPAEKRVWIDQGNIQLINGQYNDNSDDTIYYRQTNIWRHLKPFLHDSNSIKTTREKLRNSTVRIDVINSHRIKFSRYDSGILKETKIFPYVIKNGIILISCKKNKTVEGIPFIFFREHSETLNISLDKNSNMIMAYNGVASGGIFIIIFGTPIQGIHTFIRI